MKRAALLLFVIPDTSYARGIPTSKLFDYMGAGRPILGIGPQDGDAALFINQAQVGRVIDDSNSDELAAFLKQFIAKKPVVMAGATSQYTRSKLTKSLAQIFNNAL